MSSGTRPGFEGHESKRFGGSGVYRCPQVNTELMSEYCELVHQRDVHMTECVLQELCELGFFRTAERDELVDERAVERVHGLECRRVSTRHDLRRVPEGKEAVARIDSFG